MLLAPYVFHGIALRNWALHILQLGDATTSIHVLQKNLAKPTEGDLPDQHTKKRDKQDHSKEKEQAMIGQGESPEDAHETRPEILPHTRPPEEDTTTTQDDTNEEEDHSQPGTAPNNNQNNKGYAENDDNKSFGTGTRCRAGKTQPRMEPPNKDQTQDLRRFQQYTRNTSRKTTNTHQKRAPRRKKSTRRVIFKAVELRAKGSDVTWKEEDLVEKTQIQGNDKESPVHPIETLPPRRRNNKEHQHKPGRERKRITPQTPMEPTKNSRNPSQEAPLDRMTTAAISSFRYSQPDAREHPTSTQGQNPHIPGDSSRKEPVPL